MLAEAAGLGEDEEAGVAPAAEADGPPLRIKLVSYEGSKGLSAQHVFIVGAHNGDIPRDPTNASDLEICKFLVALTRTRKQCHVLHSRRWGAVFKQPSVFLNWIDAARKDHILVNADYWQ